MKKQVADFYQRIESVDHLSWTNNLDIQSVPENKKKYLFEILELIGCHIKCLITRSIVDRVCRVNFRSENVPKPIITTRYLHRNNKDASAQIKLYCKKNNYKFVWRPNGSVFIRKSVTIMTEADLIPLN